MLSNFGTPSNPSSNPKRPIRRPEDLTEQEREMALLFLSVAPQGGLRYELASKGSGFPALVLEMLDREERGEPEADPRLADLVAQAMRDTVAKETAGSGRPMPPERLLDRSIKRPLFVPAPEMTTWMLQTFIAKEGVLHSRTHWHLRLPKAVPRVLWTNVLNGRGGQRVAGTAQMLGTEKGTRNNWKEAMWESQVLDWFGALPTFLIILDARCWVEVEPARACAVVRHELLHCGQARDEWGGLRFNEETGEPLYTIRRHDVEAFVEEWADFGAEHSAGASLELLKAGMAPPHFTARQIAEACGTCRG